MRRDLESPSKFMPQLWDQALTPSSRLPGVCLAMSSNWLLDQLRVGAAPWTPATLQQQFWIAVHQQRAYDWLTSHCDKATFERWAMQPFLRIGRRYVSTTARSRPELQAQILGLTERVHLDMFPRGCGLLLIKWFERGGGHVMALSWDVVKTCRFFVNAGRRGSPRSSRSRCAERRRARSTGR